MSNKNITQINPCTSNEDGAGSQFRLKLQKYGEILVSEGGDEFILCCTRCSEIFFDYKKFLNHVHLRHDVALVANYKHRNWHNDWVDILDSKIKVEDAKDSEEKIKSYVSKESSLESPYNVANACNKSLKNNIGMEPQDFDLVEQDYTIEYLLDEEYPEIYGANTEKVEEVKCLHFQEAAKLSKTSKIAEMKQRKHSKTSHSLIRNKRFLWYFIDLYRGHPCLWRADHEHVRDRAKRFAAIEQIAATMHQRFGFQISTAKVGKTIRNIRACYLRELHRKAAAPNDTYIPKLWYYRKLSFIEDADLYEEQYGAKNGGQLPDIFAKRMPKCSKCQRDFNTRHGLAMHQRTHAPCKPFHCHQCGKSFSSRANLQAHMVSHVPVTERRYTCEFCGLKIALHHNYLVHLRRHTKLFAHHCVICGKGAANSTELKHHLLEHTGERPHCCEVCGLTFKLNGTLTRHRQQHEQ